MTDTPTDDKPGFAAEEPEHCHDCCRLIRPDQTCFLTIEKPFTCPDGIRAAGAFRLAGGLTVRVGEDELLVWRGGAVVELLSCDVRHLVDALVEAAASLARMGRSQRSANPVGLRCQELPARARLGLSGSMEAWLTACP